METPTFLVSSNWAFLIWIPFISKPDDSIASGNAYSDGFPGFVFPNPFIENYGVVTGAFFHPLSALSAVATKLPGPPWAIS